MQIADKNASDKQIAKALQKEGEAILASVRKGRILLPSVSRTGRCPARTWLP